MQKKANFLKNFRLSGMANSDADILSKLEEGSDGFVSMPIRLKKSGEPYKKFSSDEYAGLSLYGSLCPEKGGRIRRENL